MSGITSGWLPLLPSVLLPVFLGSQPPPKVLRSMESVPQTPNGSVFLSVPDWVCAGSAAVWCGWGGGIMSIWKLGTVVFANDAPGRSSVQRFKVSIACANATRVREENGGTTSS